MSDPRPAPPQDAWASGAAYEPYVGRWSRLTARVFLGWLGVPGGAAWLDVGCGTGALASTILEVAEPRAVQGIDRSPEFVAFAADRVNDPRARFETGDAERLPVESGAYDAVVSGLVFNFVPQPGRMAAEMSRAARTGGVVALYVWDYAGEMQLMRRFWDAAAALDPAARDLDEGRRFPICAPEPLERTFRDAGLAAVASRPIDIETRFRDFDDYWLPFLGGQGPAPSYVASLDPDRRGALRERVRADLPLGPDGSISLVARAWAVRGTR